MRACEVCVRCVCAEVLIFKCVRACIRLCVCVRVSVCVRACVSVSVRVSVCIYIYIYKRREIDEYIIRLLVCLFFLFWIHPSCLSLSTFLLEYTQITCLFSFVYFAICLFFFCWFIFAFPRLPELEQQPSGCVSSPVLLLHLQQYTGSCPRPEGGPDTSTVSGHCVLHCLVAQHGLVHDISVWRGLS